MITEIAILNVKSGHCGSFEKDFQRASKYISSIDGYLGHTLKRCIEDSHQYLLTVQWRSIEDHEAGFRQSPEYQKWKELLHHYYDPFPIVEHYKDVMKFGNNIS
ncbi:MAG: antibiotic biosynthesis monooxygenase [Cyclobacteriaceae bacterium]